jgi:hypothetical protein
MKTALQLARKYPTQSEAIINLIRLRGDRETLRDLLGSCTCTRNTLACTCPPEYSPAKQSDYSGHTPETN